MPIDKRRCRLILMSVTTVVNVQGLQCNNFGGIFSFYLASLKYIGNKIEIPLYMKTSFSFISKELE